MFLLFCPVFVLFSAAAPAVVEKSKSIRALAEIPVSNKPNVSMKETDAAAITDPTSLYKDVEV